MKWKSFKMKTLFAFVPVGLFMAVTWALQIRKMIKFPNPEMYE